MAGLWSTAGFALRALSTHMMREDAVYVPMQLLIILAPVWLNAFIYMVLGRMVHFFVPEQKCFGIKARKLTVIFLCLDIFSFIVQGAAGSLTSSEDPELIRIGINVCKSCLQNVRARWDTDTAKTWEVSECRNSSSLSLRASQCASTTK